MHVFLRVCVGIVECVCTHVFVLFSVCARVLLENVCVFKG